jgi:hypothetical protein
MVLRNLAGRVRERDWQAVVIEVLIVVAGVFIGLQVSNWNEDRKEAARGDEYLLRLNAELLQDVDGLGLIHGFWEQVGAYGAAALAYAESGALQQGSAWQTLLSYYQASQVWPYRKPDVTFQEIRSTGSLLLIRNETLRAEIARHYSAGAGSQVTEVLGLIPRYREHMRGLVPWKMQQYIWSECYASVGGNQALKPCASPVSEAEAMVVLEQLRQSPGLTAELRFWMVNVHNGLGLMRFVQQEARSLASEVLAERDRS